MTIKKLKIKAIIVAFKIFQVYWKPTIQRYYTWAEFIIFNNNLFNLAFSKLGVFETGKLSGL